MRKLVRENTLALRNPEVAAQWHPTLNGSLTPNNVSFGSGKKAWWICNKDHKWQAMISNRAKGKGCPFCGRINTGKKNRLLEEEFFARCRVIHGDRYDYSKTSYTSASKKVTVICQKHGEFEQLAGEHMIGRGCAKCYGRGLTGSEFIIEAKKAHGDKFDYSLIRYKDKSSPIRIVCPKHGEFEQSPKAHLRGHGCNRCGAEIRAQKKTLTKQKFIELAKAKHGDRYDYSMSAYTKANNNLTIICPIHGEFKQRAAEHTTGSGCPACGIEASRDQKKIEKEAFIKRAKEVHGDKYDYSRVEMSQAADLVIIICPEHGEFIQRGYNHLYGAGCKFCGGWLTQEQFNQAAMAIHGDKYDYSKSVYISTTNSIIVICREHGEFEQRAGGHLRGQGCPRCAPSALLTTERFIARATDVHDGRYDYSKSVYTGGQNKITIICPDHGEFEQNASAHMLGYSGCPKCSATHISQKDFITRSTAKHGNRYDYSKSEYASYNQTVKITCKLHGDFDQLPQVHWNGSGCPGCAEYGFNEAKPALVYYLKIDRYNQSPLYKIGITNRTVNERFRDAEDQSRISVIAMWEHEHGRDARVQEREILTCFKLEKYSGPDVLLSGNTELFAWDVLELDEDH